MPNYCELSTGTGEGIQNHEGVTVTCEPVTHFETATCSSTAVFGPPDAVTNTVTNLSKPVEAVVPPNITRVIAARTLMSNAKVGVTGKDNTLHKDKFHHDNFNEFTLNR